jgi:hypothetical protein
MGWSDVISPARVPRASDDPQIPMTDPLIRILGWRAMFIQGDPMVYDRLRWLRRHLRPGPLRTLDAGCGNGAFSLYAARIGNEAVGVSFDAANNRKAIARAAMLKPGGRLYLTTPYSKCPPMRGDHISAVENGDHVRWGYTHDEMRAMLADAGLATVTEEYCSGIVSRKIGNLKRGIGQLTPALGWAATFPLRAFQLADRAATEALGAPYLSIAVVAEKRA